MSLVRVFSPDTDTELVTIVEMLEAREVPCFVYSSRTGSISSGTPGRVSKPRAILVPAARLAEAVELIRSLQGSGASHGDVARHPASSWLRALVRLRWRGYRVPALRKSR